MPRRQQEEPVQHHPKAKFQEQRRVELFNVQAKTDTQLEMIKALNRKSLIIAEGHAGTGKTYLASIHAANQVLKGTAKQIILLRPYVSVGKTIGMLPGTIEEKLQPLMQPMLDVLKMVLGEARFDCMSKNREIIMEAVENVRGRSYRDAVVIVDESQNCGKEELKAIVTRMEETSQLIIIGDSHQHDLKTSGLAFLADLVGGMQACRPDYLDDEDVAVLYDKIAVIHFTVNDVVRSGLTKLFVKVFHHEE